MRFLFIMDPAQNMLPDKDTSFAFMRGAEARGHECLHCLPHQISLRGRDVYAAASRIRVSDTPPHVELSARAEVALAELEAVLIRKDPPFDRAYLQLTRQLELVAERTLVVNSPQGLRDANEKLFAFHFYEHMPTSAVSADIELIRDFVRSVGGHAVLKPLDGAGGSGVVRLSSKDENERALIDLLTQEGREPVLVQQFLPRVRQGDKRVLLLDGKLLGVILRVPRDDDFRANIHVGGAVAATELDAAEQKLVDAVAPELARRGLWFVGLDLIGGHLIEVNVTSPTGVQELGRLTGSRPESTVIEWLERRAKAIS